MDSQSLAVSPDNLFHLKRQFTLNELEEIEGNLKFWQIQSVQLTNDFFVIENLSF